MLPLSGIFLINNKKNEINPDSCLSTHATRVSEIEDEHRGPDSNHVKRWCTSTESKDKLTQNKPKIVAFILQNLHTF